MLQTVCTEDVKVQDSYSVGCVPKKELGVAKYFSERGARGKKSGLFLKLLSILKVNPTLCGKEIFKIHG